MTPPATEVPPAVDLVRFQMLRSATVLPEQPHEGMLGRQFPAGGVRGWLVSPVGKGLGFTVAGSGESLARSLAEELGRLVTADAGRVFLTLARFNGFEGLRYETVLGRPAWVRAGVRGLDEIRIGAALREEGVPAEELERVLAGPGTVLGLDVISDGKRDGLAVVRRVSELPEELGDGTRVAGATAVTVERVVGWSDTTFVRRSGLEGLELIDWQVDQGITGDSAKRVGTVHGVLGTDAPAEIAWIAGRFSESVVYVYE